MSYFKAYFLSFLSLIAIIFLHVFSDNFLPNGLLWIQEFKITFTILLVILILINLRTPLVKIEKDYFYFLENNRFSKMLSQDWSGTVATFFVVLGILRLVYIYHFAPTTYDSEKSLVSKLEIVLARPTGEIGLHPQTGLFHQISFTFNQPMVRLGDLGQYTDSEIKTIPHFDCDWKWISETTVACSSVKLARATQYKVIFPAGIMSIKGFHLEQKVEIEFSTPIPRAEYAYTDFNNAAPKLLVNFNQLVRPETVDIAIHCANGKFNQARPKLVKKESFQYGLKLQNVNEIVQNRNCQIVINEGVASIEGHLKSVHKYEDLYQIPHDVRQLNMSFQVSKLNCSGSTIYDEIFSEQINCGAGSEIEIVFNREIYGYELKKHNFNLSPHAYALKGDFKPEELEDNKKYRSVVVHKKLEQGTIYKIELDKNLTSIEGEKINVIGPILISPKSEPPSFNASFDSVVKELYGPWKVPYQVKNILALTINWKLFTSAEELHRFLFFKKDKYQPTYSLKDEEVSSYEEKINIIPNVGEVIPLDLKKLNSKPGLFVLNFTRPKVDEDFLKAYEEIIKADRRMQDEWSIKYNNGMTRKWGPIRPFDISHNASVLITDIGMHAKVGFFNTVVWVYSIRSGKPISGVEVKLFDSKKIIDQGVSNKLGIVELKGKRNFDEADTRFLIAAQKNDELSYLNQEYRFGEGLNPWEFNIKGAYLSKDNDFIVQTITDRPIYKPGEEVSLKIFTREWDHKTLTFLARDWSEVDVKVLDSVGSEIYTQNKLKLSDFGTTSLNFPLKVDAKTGKYIIQVKKSASANIYSSWNETRNFSVQEFRASNFELNVKTDKEAYSIGQKIKASVKAEYLFGGAVKNAQGDFFAQFVEEDFNPKQDEYKKYFYNEYDYEDYTSGYKKSKVLLSGVLKTDSSGEFEFEVPLDNVGSKYGNIVVEAGIEDEHGAKIANRKSVKYTDETPFLGAHLDKWSYEVKDKIKTNLLLLNAKSEYVENEKISVKLVKINYITTRRLGTGNYYYFDYQKLEEVVDTCEAASTKGPSACFLSPKEAGAYYVQASIGSETKKRTTYVYGGAGYTSWGHFNHDRIDIIPEKTEYTLGETVRLLIKSPFPEAKTLITIERHGVLESKVIDIKTGAYLHEFKLDNNFYAPGVFISATLLQGRTSEKVEGDLDLGKPSFKIGYAGIKVVNPDNKIEIAVKTKKNIYAPSENIEGELTLKNFKGRPIVGEVAIAVVDQAILQLVSDFQASYDLYNTFYAAPGLDVDNYQTLNSLMGRSTFGKKGGTAGGGGGDNLSLRENFLPLAYWQPAQVTNSEGELKFSFKAPDNLTKWRVIVAATDKEHRFGYGDSTFRVNKDLMLTEALPNFLIENDILKAKFVVHNRSDKNLKVNYKIESSDFEVKGPEGEVSVIKDDKNDFNSDIIATKIGQPELTARIKADHLSDGIKVSVPVIAKGEVLTEAIFGTTKQSEFKREYIFPDDSKVSSRKLNLLFSTSILQGLDESFRYVIDYPYGCWEQRLSKTLFLGQYENLKPWLKDFSTQIPIKLTINQILGEASKFQNASGGMIYYPSEYGYESEYLSFFTGYAFNILEKQGYSIDQNVKNNLQKYLTQQISGSSWRSWWDADARESMKVQIIYLLKDYFNQNVDSFLSKYLAQMNELDLEGQVFLLRTISGMPKFDSFKEKLVANIMNKFNIEARKVTLAPDYKLHKYMLRTETKTVCQILSALVQSSPNLEVIPKLVNSISLMRDNGHWYNTQENMFCFEALYKYAQVFEKEFPEIMVSVFNNAKKIGGVNIKSRDSSVQNINIVSNELATSGNIVVKKNGSGRLYYSILQKYRTNKLDPSKLNNGISIKKEIYRFTENGEWEKLPEGDIKVAKSDILKVLLSIKSEVDRFQVAINDPLAGGLEPINTALATASRAAEAFKRPVDFTVQDKYDFFSYFYRSNGFTHMDLRLQSVQLYTDWLAAGTYHVEYMLQVIAAGKFTMNPTKVEEMYYPEVNGLAAGREVTILEN